MIIGHSIAVWASFISLGQALPYQVLPAGSKVMQKGEGGAAKISGVILPKKGVTCLQFKLEDGRTVSLMGVDFQTKRNIKLSLTGQWVLRSPCQQGQTFQVSHIEDFKK